MQIDEFWRALRQSGTYATSSAPRRSVYGRLLSSRADFFYYVDEFHVVVSAYFISLRGRFDRRAWASHALMMLRAAERCGCVATLGGFENIALARLPVVYVANHMSSVETLVLPGALLGFGDVVTVLKQSLHSYPLFGRVVTAVEPIGVTRRDPREDLREVLAKGEAFLRSGRSVLIFPQATRAPEFDPADFNSLGVKLARNAGVQVIPVALKTDFQGIGRWIRDLGPLQRQKPIRIKVGKPLNVEGNGREAQEAVVTFISDTLRSWGATVKEPALH